MLTHIITGIERYGLHIVMMIILLSATICQQFLQFLLLQKFLRKMGGKKLHIGMSIKIIRLLFNVACQNCEEKLMG